MELGGGSRGGEEYIVSQRIRMRIEDDNVLDDEPWKQKGNPVSHRPRQDRYIPSDFSRQDKFENGQGKKGTEQGEEAGPDDDSIRLLFFGLTEPDSREELTCDVRFSGRPKT